MILAPLFTALVLATTTLSVLAQTSPCNPCTDPTLIVGTWSSGSQGVVTGAGFASPSNESFFYPKTTGISYSFTSDGYYETARYRFNSNGSEPTCITGVIVWTHGLYTLNANGSMTLSPFGDGYQQVQDPCAAQSNFIQNYNLTEYYTQWLIFTDPTAGYKLHLFQYDGSPLAPQFQVSSTPNMLPTQVLRNVTPPTTITNGYAQSVVPRSNDAAPQWGGRTGSAALAALVGLAVASVSL